MTNNGPTYTTANGFSLDTLGWGVVSHGGVRWNGPAKVGEDLRVPFRNGRIPILKSREAKPYNINMLVSTLDADGNRTPGMTTEQRFTRNIQEILAAVDVEGQFPLVKRWYEDTDLITATATAEYLDASGPGSDDLQSFDLNLNFMLADPYFYGAGATGLALGAPVNILGNAVTSHVTLNITSGANTLVTFPDGNWVQNNGATGGTVVIDCFNGTAKVGAQFVNGLILRNPKFPRWPTLSPGSNAITVTGGTATVTYDAAFR